ncbi:MAG: PEGA domain-containing protein [Acidobacteria bacterium]|nr:PEGA domain-containing protein [Acidobacteriota bacterium]
MNRVAVIALAAAGVAAAAAVVVLRMDAPEPEAAVAVTSRAPAPRRAPPTPEASPTAPERAAPRSAPSPVTEAPAAEAPPPVVEAPRNVGILRIDSDVPGAQVFIDRRFIGAAPVVADDVTPGTHQLNVSAEGFESVATSIDVAAGPRDIVVKLREVRLNASADVVHRHGVGSCRGRLVATLKGLRYETTNKDDAFETALLGLETFQVDYLAKNLRVKLPKGRQFNFTDPEGNADRLFVFHRDVEKARERLRKGDTPATN